MILEIFFICHNVLCIWEVAVPVNISISRWPAAIFGGTDTLSKNRGDCCRDGYAETTRYKAGNTETNIKYLMAIRLFKILDGLSGISPDKIEFGLHLVMRKFFLKLVTLAGIASESSQRTEFVFDCIQAVNPRPCGEFFWPHTNLLVVLRGTYHSLIKNNLCADETTLYANYILNQ